MNEKYKSALGLAAIILGVGISWMVIMYFIKPITQNVNIKIEKITSEIEVTNVNKSAKFYNIVLLNKRSDSLSSEKLNRLLNGNEIGLIETKDVFKSKLSIKVNNIESYKMYLEKNKIPFDVEDTTLIFYDPDSNKIIAK